MNNLNIAIPFMWIVLSLVPMIIFVAHKKRKWFNATLVLNLVAAWYMVAYILIVTR